jgi:sodium transport system permease protein
MKLGDVALVAAKELRETLRDRRTLVVMVLFPLVVYPLVSLLMAQVMATHTAHGEARRSRVAVVGPAGLAEPVRARLRADAKAYAPDALAGDGRTSADAWPASADDGRVAVESGTYDAVAQVEAGPHGQTRVRLLYDEARDESRQAHERVGGTLGGVLAPGCATLFALEDQNVAPRARVGGYVLSKLLPLVVVVMIMLGAFYPAIDITAGERERGTLETILSAPIDRFDLMTGKVIAVATLSTITGLLNMTSMSLTMIEGIKLVGATAPVTIPWTRTASMLIVVVPAAFLFAAVMVAIGAMARSFKEAQTLLTPVYFLCFTPSLIAGLGDWELSGAAIVVPGVNVTLLARDLILGKATLGSTLAVVASTLAFGALALTLAARLYDSERLLASSESTLSLGAWLRRLLGLDERAVPIAEDGPNPGHALALFAIGFLLLGLSIPLQRWRLAPGILISEWGGMLGLVALYARGIGRPLVEVLRLHRVPARALAGATLMGLSAWVVLGFLSRWFVPPPPGLEESMRHLVMPNDGSRGVGLTLLLIAVTPAICEEALFRGPILRGFSAGLPRMTSAVLTGVLFGLYHLDLWRLLPTALLGIGLSLVALETGSIVPSMLAHFTNNACLVVLAYLGADDAATGTMSRPAQAGMFLGGLAVLSVGALLVRGTGPKAPTL